MTRAPFQVIVIPFRRNIGALEYALFRRADSGHWQFIAGGGEEGETPIQAARREALEEAGFPESLSYVTLDSVSSIPKSHFQNNDKWTGLYVIPEYSFGVDAASFDIILSSEHSEYGWFRYNNAQDILKWDSNKTALWELNQRLTAV